MNSAGRSNISSIFQQGLQDGYLSLNPHVKGGLFPLMPGVQSLLKVAIHGGGGATRPDLGRAVQFEGHWIARPNPGRQRAGGAAGAGAE